MESILLSARLLKKKPEIECVNYASDRERAGCLPNSAWVEKEVIFLCFELSWVVSLLKCASSIYVHEFARDIFPSEPSGHILNSCLTSEKSIIILAVWNAQQERKKMSQTWKQSSTKNVTGTIDKPGAWSKTLAASFDQTCYRESRDIWTLKVLCAGSFTSDRSQSNWSVMLHTVFSIIKGDSHFPRIAGSGTSFHSYSHLVRDSSNDYVSWLNMLEAGIPFCHDF